MSFQICPVCGGVGNVYPPVGYAVECPTCKGKRIIDDITGKPPKDDKEITCQE